MILFCMSFKSKCITSLNWIGIHQRHEPTTFSWCYLGNMLVKCKQHLWTLTLKCYAYVCIWSTHLYCYRWCLNQCYTLEQWHLLVWRKNLCRCMQIFSLLTAGIYSMWYCRRNWPRFWLLRVVYTYLWYV